MRKTGFNPGINAAHVFADCIREIKPATAAADLASHWHQSTLKDHLEIPRRVANRHQRRSSAHHESGHIMGALEGGALSIEAIVRQDATGYCRAETIENPEASIIFTLAGPFAEVRFNPPSIHNFVNPPCADFLSVRGKIDALNASRLWPQLTYRTAAKNAMWFVEKHWPQIQNLALALDDAGELDDFAIRIFAKCVR